MKPINQAERNRRTLEFGALYAGMLLLLLAVLYLSFVKIPRRSVQNVQVAEQQQKAFLTGIHSLNSQVSSLEATGDISPESLQRVYNQIAQLREAYPDSAFQKVLRSYSLMVGQLDNAAATRDAELTVLNAKFVNLKGEIEQLLAQLKAKKDENDRKEEDKKNKDKVEFVSVPVPPKPVKPTYADLKEQTWGPFIPKLQPGSSGNGYFQTAHPYVEAQISFRIDGDRLLLHVDFGASFRPKMPNGINSRVVEDRTIFTAPEGTRIEPEGLPLGRTYEYAETDAKYDEDQVELDGGLLELHVWGNTDRRIGDKFGTRLEVRLNRPLRIKLIPE